MGRAEAEGRELTPRESDVVAEMDGAIAGLRKQLSEPQQPLTVLRNGRLQVAGCGPFNTLGEQLLAVRNAGVPGGQIDARLYQVRAAATGLGETVQSDGGFLVQTDFQTELLQDVMQTGILARRCRRIPISTNANAIKIPGVDETSRASTRSGGIHGYWLAEAAEKQASKPKFRQIELGLKKCVVLIYSTDELLQDASALEAFIRQAAPAELAFQLDDAIINGDGVGRPLGFMQGGSLVTVAAEAGQHLSIIAENVIKMVERTLGPSSNYVWLHSKSCLSQIYSLALSVGTGGVPLFMAGGSIPNQPENRLLGLPLIECEQCQVLGTTGDLVLADLANGYVLAEKGGVQADVSIHVQFVYDQSVFRFVLRVDGQPVRASALTPYKGGASYSQSHFIALATRSA